jgi:hypothetical protein
MDITPLHTKLEKEIQLTNGSVVLEHPVGFPRSKCNLYYVRQDGSMIWTAEKPELDSLFSRLKFSEDGNSLDAYTTDGYACSIDIKTGKLISKSKLQ